VTRPQLDAIAREHGALVAHVREHGTPAGVEIGIRLLGATSGAVESQARLAALGAALEPLRVLGTWISLEVA
jgi:hypothetical protein